PSFPEAPTMHTLISSSHQLTGTQIWPAFRARHEKENAGVTEAQQGRPQCSGVSEGLPAFVSSLTILRADMKAYAAVKEARLEDVGSGLAPVTEGWFVVNVRDAAWFSSETRGAACW